MYISTDFTNRRPNSSHYNYEGDTIFINPIELEWLCSLKNKGCHIFGVLIASESS